MSYEKIATLVKRLIRNTEEDNIEWEETEKQSVFQTSFPNYSVRLYPIQAGPNEDDFDYYVQIINANGDIVEEINDSDLQNYLPNAYQSMRDMYELVRRKAMGVDQALDDILDILQDPDEIPF